MMGKLRVFEIVFDNGKSVYNPSELVNGKCVVDLRGDMKMKSLRILMRGVAKVHWTESRSTGNRLGAYTEHYNAEIEYFLKRQVLFGSGNYNLSCKFFYLTSIFMSCVLTIEPSYLLYTYYQTSSQLIGFFGIFIFHLK